MQTDTDADFDAKYLAKFTADEVGADIETHGHIPVTPETATQNPFTHKGALANALDEASETDAETQAQREAQAEENESVENDPPQEKPNPMLHGEEVRPENAPKLYEHPNQGELSGEIEGVSDDTQMGEDSAPTVKGTLSAAFDEAFAQDAEPEQEGEYDPEADKRVKPPELPPSLKTSDDADENGLVYITRTFTVDPAMYISPNYRPKGVQTKGVPIGSLRKQMQTQTPQADAPEATGEATETQETEISEVETTAQGDAQNTSTEEVEVKKESEKGEPFIPGAEVAEAMPEKHGGIERKTEDGAETVALDFATFLDGSSFLCCDEANGIDYSKIAMDAGPRKKVTRENCETTFAQCRAANPLFCRFHGPKLIEADIRTAIAAQLRGELGKEGTKGFTLSVTKDKNAPNPMTFRVTIGCTPRQKKRVEQMLDDYLTENPGIKPRGEKTKLEDTGELTQEFEMDILRADKPPKVGDLKGEMSIKRRDKAVAGGKEMPVVGETPNRIERAVNGEAEGESEANEGEEPPPENVTPEPQPPEEPAKEQPESQTEPSKPEGEGEITEEEMGESAEKVGNGKDKEEVMRGIRERLDGKRPVTKEELDLFEKNDPFSRVAGEMRKAYEATQNSEGGKEEKGESQLEEAAKEAERAMEDAGTADIGKRIADAVEEAETNGNVEKELKGKMKDLKKKGGAGAALIGTAAGQAAEEAAEAAKDAAERALGELAELQKRKDEGYRETERKAKGETAAAIENALVEMAKSIFPADSKSDTVEEAAAEIATGLDSYAHEKGIADWNASEAFDKLMQKVKESSKRIEGLMEEFRDAMERTGEDFQAEDIEQISQSIGKAAKDTQRHFDALKGMAEKERGKIDKAAQLAEAIGGGDATEKGGGKADAKSFFKATSYEAYGDAPNEDPDTSEFEPGGTGDVLGAELLRYAAQRGGLLRMPKGYGEYRKALAQWKDADKKGKMYKGRPTTKLNKPKMKDFGIVDPMADYIDNLFDGGMKKNNALVKALFGYTPRVGSNDEALDDAPPEIQAALEKNGMEWICDRFLKARDDYADWYTKQRDARRRLKEQKDDHGELVSLAELESRDEGQTEYDNAFAEVARYEADTPTIRNFSRAQMRNLVKGDTIRFDHSEAEWDVVDYDKDTDELTVVEAGALDNPLMGEDEIAEVTAVFKISENGIEEIDKTGKEKENGRKDERGTAKDVAGDAQGETGGARGEPAGGQAGDAQSRIAAVYKDWVEEEVPEWAKELPDDVAEEYAQMLEAAQNEGDEGDFSALEKLNKFEEGYKAKEAEKSEKAEAEARKRESEAMPDTRKAAMEASRRLGLDAYKPDEELAKMLAVAKAHASDPRMAQRIKDIEAIQADRKAKGKREVTEAEKAASRAERKFKDRMGGGATLTPSEAFYRTHGDTTEGYGRGDAEDIDDEPPTSKNAEDEMPKQNKTEESAQGRMEIIMQALVKALEG